MKDVRLPFHSPYSNPKERKFFLGKSHLRAFSLATVLVMVHNNGFKRPVWYMPRHWSPSPTLVLQGLLYGRKKGQLALYPCIWFILGPMYKKLDPDPSLEKQFLTPWISLIFWVTFCMSASLCLACTPFLHPISSNCSRGSCASAGWSQ